MTNIIDGRRFARAWLQEVKNEITTLGLRPGLAVILVGDDPASHLYVRLKEKAAQAVGIKFYKTLLPADTAQSALNLTIQQFNNDSSVQAILLQLPLPGDLDENTAVAGISPTKDVDGFHPANQKLFLAHRGRLMPPPIAAVLESLKATGQPLKGKTAVLRVNSSLFGKMLKAGLNTLGIASTIVLPPETNAALLKADIVVSARGTPQAVKAEEIKKSAILIDVGTTKVGSKIVGDFSPEALERSSFYTPVPGGIGPLTVAILMRNVVELSKR